LFLGELVLELLELSAVLHVHLGELCVELVSSVGGLVELFLEAFLVGGLGLEAVGELVALDLQTGHSELPLVRVLTRRLLHCPSSHQNDLTLQLRDPVPQSLDL
jgi:hypothetical protein